MLYITLTILVISIVLFIASFFMSDRFANLEEMIEQQSITLSQDAFYMKKKINDLDERIQTNSNVINKSVLSEDKSPLVTQKIYHLHQQGLSVEDIAKRTDLTTEEVEITIKDNK